MTTSIYAGTIGQVKQLAFHGLVDAARDAIGGFDREQHYVNVNAPLERATGVPGAMLRSGDLACAVAHDVTDVRSNRLLACSRTPRSSASSPSRLA